MQNHFTRLLSCIFGGALVLLVVTMAEPVFAQESAGPRPRTLTASERPLPSVFTLPAPRNGAELKAIQDHVTQQFPTWAESTVNLAVGGRRGAAQGSGVIVSPEGLILTAAHVSGAPGQPVTITTHDGKSYPGITLGRNTTLDASLVRFEDPSRRDWPAAPVAMKAAVEGDWCAVLGHPGGYQSDRGVVLRLGRVILQNKWLIQTDCELIGGDSGGPLFNMRGEVIGINTRIGESTEFNIHVPIEVYTRDWKRLVDSEDFRTHSGAYLGLSGVPAPSGEGLLVEKLTPGEAAENQGIRVGDILLTCQGEKITDLAQLTELIGRRFPGQTAQITLRRNGETLTVTPRLGMRRE
ncbi:MAG TPA: trypsin-like peptidase domain-containing protein [Planctomicrobium sp.]|nr:trypsin-like peptidase domain-containing protein [Planctomicrobium sp.]